MSISVTVTETPSVDLTVAQATGAGLNVDISNTAHNSLENIQGGQQGEYYHLTAAEYADLGGSDQRFDTSLPSGIEETGIEFATAFDASPIVQCELQLPDDGERTYFIAVRNITTTGFFVEFSDNIGTGYTLQTRAIPNT